MMVRDRGHALTIDIDTSKDDYFVKYFIPKLCNEDMIKALPGINKDNISNNGTSGKFICNNKEFTDKLFSFIEKVPTDNDMPSIHPPYEQVSNEINFDNFNVFEDIPTSQPEPPLFPMYDIKEITTEQGKTGRRFENILNLLSKFNIFSKNKNKTTTKEDKQEVKKDDK